MKRIERSLEEVEDFAALLAGPLGDTLRGAGAIIQQRLRQRRLVWADLDDQAVADLFIAALMQAVLDAHPDANRDVVESALATLSSSIYMAFAANSGGGTAIN
ncbi:MULTISPECIES: hypothetical protein [unclassified Brevundimonas]|uniref:hypothetical protein n=1 Tax=unclassified Brevundimonas TaxID=2622653 RepID=UPI0025BABC84|nr:MULTISPECIES: hypothetical protein [unclassified Brevundimonas]